jgi:hypothetical protein
VNTFVCPHLHYGPDGDMNRVSSDKTIARHATTNPAREASGLSQKPSLSNRRNTLESLG